MIQTTAARVLVGAVNLLIAASPLAPVQNTQALNLESKTEKLNVASLKSIESSWLKIPAACKARGFNADVSTLDTSSVSPGIRDLYASFSV